MSEFDKWFDEQERVLYKDDKWIAKKAWDARQAEIDAITKQRDSFIKAHHISMNEVCEHKAKIDELQARVDDLTELNRLKTIALQQSVNRTSIHVHEKIVALEKKLKGNKDE